MDNTIRVLALNDDNHATTFYSEDRTIEMNGHEFIPFLAQAHSINYDVRCVYICDMPEEEIFNQAFDTIDCKVPYFHDFDNAFNILWAVASRDIYL